MDEDIKDGLKEVSEYIMQKLLLVNGSKDKVKFLMDVLNETNCKLLELLEEKEEETDQEEEGYGNSDDSANSDLSESEFESDLE